MKESTLKRHKNLIVSTKRGAHQEAHQKQRSAFNAFLFQVFGYTHILPACIQHPACSDAQPVSSWIASFMQAWETETTSPEYRKRREISK